MTSINEDREMTSRVRTLSDASIEKASTVAWRTRYTRLLLILDLVGVTVAVALAQWLRFGGPLATQKNDAWHYFEVSAAIAVCWMLALTINNSRSERVVGCGAEEYRRVWVATLSVFWEPQDQSPPQKSVK